MADHDLIIRQRKYANDPIQDFETYYLVRVSFISSIVVIFLIPTVLCSIGKCDAYKGQCSISSAIQALPYATTYCLFAAIFLFTLLYIQLRHTKKGLKLVCAIFGAACLAVPLMLPLDSGVNDVFHDFFAAVGFSLEGVYTLCVLLDVVTAEETPNGSFVVYCCSTGFIAGLLIFIVGFFSSSDSEFFAVNQIIAEYFVGISVAAVTGSLELYPFYPMRSYTDFGF